MNNAKNQKLITSFVAILAVVIVAFGVSYFSDKQSGGSDTSDAVTAAQPTNSSSNSNNNSNSVAGKFKDGSYSANGSYNSPGGKETITVNLTVKDGTVTASSVEQVANNRTGAQYQDDFKQNYKTYVVGKALKSISLSGVSGSSLTSEGFNAALQTIKSQAAES